MSNLYLFYQFLKKYNYYNKFINWLEQQTKNDKVPEWFNKEISRVEPKEVEKKKVEELLKEFM